MKKIELNRLIRISRIYKNREYPKDVFNRKINITDPTEITSLNNVNEMFANLIESIIAEKATVLTNELKKLITFLLSVIDIINVKINFKNARQTLKTH